MKGLRTPSGCCPCPTAAFPLGVDVVDGPLEADDRWVVGMVVEGAVEDGAVDVGDGGALVLEELPEGDTDTETRSERGKRSKRRGGIKRIDAYY